MVTIKVRFSFFFSGGLFFVERLVDKLISGDSEAGILFQSFSRGNFDNAHPFDVSRVCITYIYFSHGC